jgi:hypothetical protein
LLLLRGRITGLDSGLIPYGIFPGRLGQTCGKGGLGSDRCL